LKIDSTLWEKGAFKDEKHDYLTPYSKIVGFFINPSHELKT